MGRGRVVIASVAVTLALVAACGGQSQAPPAAAQQLPCEVTLASDCCGTTNGTACINDFASAELCSNWPGTATVLVYSSVCGGYQVVSVKEPTDTFTQYYLYSTAEGQTLYAIADDANSNAQGAAEIECGAGPTGFTLPSGCSEQWLDGVQAASCASGTSAPQAVPCN
jgi:hypothetical protein